jgi:hypothetical protein
MSRILMAAANPSHQHGSSFFLRTCAHTHIFKTWRFSLSGCQTARQSALKPSGAASPARQRPQEGIDAKAALIESLETANAPP